MAELVDWRTVIAALRGLGEDVKAEVRAAIFETAAAAEAEATSRSPGSLGDSITTRTVSDYRVRVVQTQRKANFVDCAPHAKPRRTNRGWSRGTMTPTRVMGPVGAKYRAQLRARLQALVDRPREV